MAKLELFFSTKPAVQLVRTRFSYPSLRVVNRTAHRGQYEQCFPWSQGTRSLCLFLLRCAAWTRPDGASELTELPSLEGRRPSPASTLNDVLSARRAGWLHAIFGGQMSGDPVLVQLTRVKNRDFKTAPGASVLIELETSSLSPTAILVYRDEVILEKAADIEELSSDIERQYWKSTGAKVPKPRDEHSEPAGVAGNADASTRDRKIRPTVRTAADYVAELKALTTPGHYRDFVQTSQDAVGKMLRDPGFQQFAADGGLGGSIEEYAEGFLRYLGQHSVAATEVVSRWFRDLERDPWWIKIPLRLEPDPRRSPGDLVRDMANLAMARGDLLSLCWLLHSAYMTHQVAVVRDTFLARLLRLPEDIGMEVFTQWAALLGGDISVLDVIPNQVPAFIALQAKDVKWFVMFQFLHRDSITSE